VCVELAVAGVLKVGSAAGQQLILGAPEELAQRWVARDDPPAGRHEGNSDGGGAKRFAIGLEQVCMARHNSEE
jgi:hypothetical protein